MTVNNGKIKLKGFGVTITPKQNFRKNVIIHMQ